MSLPDVVVVGGGLVGLATARALAQQHRVTLLETEDGLARHQSGHNSGVVHSGLYYRPGSLKATLCRRGRRALLDLCEARGLPLVRSGKLVVATDEDELAALDELERRGRANGLQDLERLDGRALRGEEAEVRGLAGLRVGDTALTHFPTIARALADDFERAGGRLVLGQRVRTLRWRRGAVEVETTQGTLTPRFAVACAGLTSDRLARRSGLDPGVKIVPFRGDYFELLPEVCSLVRRPIYPVPDPRFPFLGVHLTPTVDGRLEAGPNAVLALHRTAYHRLAFSARDTLETLSYPGFWRLARRYWRTGLGEMGRSLGRGRFAAALARLVPAIRPGQLRRAGCGIRAQAVDPEGHLVDDFHLLEEDGMLFVLNAPSPAATACLAIADYLVERIEPRL